jgi:hypothetical protein
MIWKNGFMNLLLLKELEDGCVLFLNTNNNELIKAYDATLNFQNKTVTWMAGTYYGNIKNYISLEGSC